MSKAADTGRIIHITKQRERDKEDIEKHKQKLEKERQSLQSDIHSKFTTNVDRTEDQLKADTVGLVTLDKMKEKQMEILKQVDDLITGKEPVFMQEKPTTSSKKVTCTAEKRFLSFGSFDDEDEEEEVNEPVAKKRLGMNPDVETSFLPDREREQELMKRKEELAQEWRQLQDKEKNEEINVAYCYWDGSGHRKDTKMKKGATISQFLQKATLKKEFTELRTITTENLMFVKEDLILPHFYTFQDFIVTRTMGKTGPLWQFDAAGEIRVRQDAALDCGESHPVKVAFCSWVVMFIWILGCLAFLNKHIYPASRWEPFVPNKDYQRTVDDLTKI